MAESVGAEKAGPAGKASPEEMLKQAVGAASAKPAEAAAVAPKRRPFRLTANGRLAAAACAALVGGVCIGLGLAEPPRERSGEALLQLRAGIEAGRAETLRLSQEVERLARTASALREASEATRTETKALGGSIGRLEQGLDKRFATLSDTFAQAEREQGARLAGLTLTVEKKLQATVPAPPKPEARIETKPEIRPEAKPEPVQTGSLPDRAKPETVEGWAVRDVYDGVAILEDRRRRLVEVGAGDAVPGVGRVEAIERRGRNWVVVTRQGLITPQAW
ncbi:hypothetical protein ASG52_04165 [Methylobacterium sp. Leaf456]|uniref:hypothetical protein n=1 Tax=Methylobacterium sp. Leaf456 TaxID=1736382 RepID=UPI0006FC66B8|nr:hypothetical protein [Methylobacterium sp. Leaf456]KQT53331.1 hypothetical protein ASG52_04165 [Methylobacterium sp. Leaf456]